MEKPSERIKQNLFGKDRLHKVLAASIATIAPILDEFDLRLSKLEKGTPCATGYHKFNKGMKYCEKCGQASR